MHTHDRNLAACRACVLYAASFLKKERQRPAKRRSVCRLRQEPSFLIVKNLTFTLYAFSPLQRFTAVFYFCKGLLPFNPCIRSSR
jgi:hypothetical protein